jgi:hypothetical protein
MSGSTSFALIGDSGSGDAAQRDVANAMLRYFTTARRFSFVRMLGDNLYDDDYQGEFAVPYRGLLVSIRDSPCSFTTITWSRHSRRMDPISRSTYAFCHGEREAVRRSSMPRPPTVAASAEGIVAVVHQGARGRVVRKRLSELLRLPRRRRMCGHSDVYGGATAMREHHEHE